MNDISTTANIVTLAEAAAKAAEDAKNEAITTQDICGSRSTNLAEIAEAAGRTAIAIAKAAEAIAKAAAAATAESARATTISNADYAKALAAAEDAK